LINPDKKINPKSGSNYFWFRSGKIHRTEGEFAGKLLDGDYDLFGPDSELFQKGQYRNGRRKGKWKSWYSNGALASIIIYKKGNQSGRAIFFEKKGKLRLSSKFSHGKKNGREKEFKNGVKSAIRRYNDGDLVWEKIIVF